MQPGGIYLLSKGSLKPKNARFNSTRHDFEIFLERGSALQPVDAGDADAAAIPRIQYSVSGPGPSPGAGTERPAVFAGLMRHNSPIR